MAEDVLLSSITDEQVAKELGVPEVICRAVLRQCRSKSPQATVAIKVVDEAGGRPLLAFDHQGQNVCQEFAEELRRAEYAGREDIPARQCVVKSD